MAQTEWIKTSSGIPSSSRKVLLFVDYTHKMTGYWVFGRKAFWVHELNGYRELDTVSHWKELGPDPE